MERKKKSSSKSGRPKMATQANEIRALLARKKSESDPFSDTAEEHPSHALPAPVTAAVAMEERVAPARDKENAGLPVVDNREVAPQVDKYKELALKAQVMRTLFDPRNKQRRTQPAPAKDASSDEEVFCVQTRSDNLEAGGNLDFGPSGTAEESSRADELRAEKERLAAEKSRVEEENVRVQSELSKLRADQERTEQEKRLADKARETLENENQSLNEEKLKNKKELEDLRKQLDERQNANSENLQKQQLEKEEISLKLRELNAEKETLAKKQKDAARELENLKDEMHEKERLLKLAKKEKTNDLLEKEREIDDLKKQIDKETDSFIKHDKEREAKISHLEGLVKNLDATLKEANDKFAEKSDELEKQRKEQGRKEQNLLQELQKGQSERDALSVRVERYEADLAEKEREVRKQRLSLDGAREEVESISGKLETARKRAAERENDREQSMKELEKEMQLLKGEAKRASADLEKAKLASEQRIAHLEREATRLADEKRAAEAQRDDQIRKAAADTTREIGRLTQSHDREKQTLQAEIDSLKLNKSDTEAELERVRGEGRRWEAELAELRLEAERLRRRAEQAELALRTRDDIQALHARLEERLVAELGGLVERSGGGGPADDETRRLKARLEAERSAFHDELTAIRDVKEEQVQSLLSIIDQLQREWPHQADAARLNQQYAHQLNDCVTVFRILRQTVLQW